MAQRGKPLKSLEADPAYPHGQTSMDPIPPPEEVSAQPTEGEDLDLKRRADRFQPRPDLRLHSGPDLGDHPHVIGVELGDLLRA